MLRSFTPKWLYWTNSNFDFWQYSIAVSTAKPSPLPYQNRQPCAVFPLCQAHDYIEDEQNPATNQGASFFGEIISSRRTSPSSRLEFLLSRGIFDKIVRMSSNRKFSGVDETEKILAVISGLTAFFLAIQPSKMMSLDDAN